MLWAILWLLGNIFIAVNTMLSITSDHTCRGALPLPRYVLKICLFWTIFIDVPNCISGARYLCNTQCSVYSLKQKRLCGVEWSEVATRTPAAEQCPWSPHIAEWSPPPPVWMRTWAREWKLQSNKLDSGITPSLEIIFNKFPKVADFDYIFQPGAGNWLKRVGCPNLCIPGCMKYDYGSTIWIAF